MTRRLLCLAGRTPEEARAWLATFGDRANVWLAGEE